MVFSERERDHYML